MLKAEKKEAVTKRKDDLKGRKWVPRRTHLENAVSAS